MAISLVGIAIIPLMGASWVLVRSTAFNRSNTKVETVIANAADRVNRAAEGCDYTIYVEAAALSQGWAQGQVSATYSYWDTNTGDWVAGACPNGVRPDGLVQQVRITVTSPDGQVTRSMQVVKSDV
jgi:hypothetical protein